MWVFKETQKNHIIKKALASKKSKPEIFLIWVFQRIKETLYWITKIDQKKVNNRQWTYHLLKSSNWVWFKNHIMLKPRIEIKEKETRSNFLVHMYDETKENDVKVEWNNLKKLIRLSTCVKVWFRWRTKTILFLNMN